MVLVVRNEPKKKKKERKKKAEAIYAGLTISRYNELFKNNQECHVIPNHDKPSQNTANKGNEEPNGPEIVACSKHILHLLWTTSRQFSNKRKQTDP